MAACIHMLPGRLSNFGDKSPFCCLLKGSLIFELTVPCRGDDPKSIQMSEDSSRGCRHQLWASSYYYTALEIAPLLKLQAYSGLRQNSMSSPQQRSVCVRAGDIKRTMEGCFGKFNGNGKKHPNVNNRWNRWVTSTKLHSSILNIVKSKSVQEFPFK